MSAEEYTGGEGGGDEREATLEAEEEDRLNAEQTGMLLSFYFFRTAYACVI